MDHTWGKGFVMVCPAADVSAKLDDNCRDRAFSICSTWEAGMTYSVWSSQALTMTMKMMPNIPKTARYQMYQTMANPKRKVNAPIHNPFEVFLGIKMS
jgi:hypothetical protein